MRSLVAEFGKEVCIHGRDLLRLPVGNGANEILTISNDQKSIFFSAPMGGSLDKVSLELDPKRLSAEAVTCR